MKYKIPALIILISFSLFLFTCDNPEEEDVTAPGAPLNLNYDANESGDGEIFLTWEAPDDKDVATFHIYRDSGSGTFTEVASVTVTNYLDQHLDYSIEYSYKVTAKDDSGNESTFSNTVSLTPVNLYSPATPSGLTIKAHNIPAEFKLNVELAWTGNTESDFAYYKIYRSDVSALFAPDASTEIDSLSGVYYFDEDVSVGTTYHYKIIAYDLGDKGSDPSDVVSDTPLEVPTLIAPIGNVVTSSATPTFHWTNVDKAVKYKIIVRSSAQTGDIWESTVPATSEAEMSVSYPSNPSAGEILSANTSYYWFVSAYSQDNDEINTYTAVNAFRTPE